MKSNKARRILIYRIGQIGDTVIALPSLWALRRQFPGAHLALLCDSHSASNYVLANRVLPSEGLIDEVLTYAASASGGPSSLLGLLMKLRRLRFDTLAYLAPSLRTPLQVKRDLAFFRLAGIRNFLGQRGFSSTCPQVLPDGTAAMQEHEADHLLGRLGRSGIPVPSPGKGEMNLALTDEERSAVEGWLRVNVPDYGAEMNLVGLGPGSKFPSKIWPEERYAELGKRLINEGLYPIVFGGAEDAAAGNRLTNSWGGGTNAAGTLDIRHAAAALAHCKLYVGNDSGTMHLAAAVGTRCVGIFSARDWPGRWSPYGKTHTVLRRAVHCQGCMLEVCGREELRCLKEITVSDVMNACKDALAQANPTSLKVSAERPLTSLVSG